MFLCSRRVAIVLLVTGSGCRRITTLSDRVIAGPLPTADELFASGRFPTLRFHRRRGNGVAHTVVDMWCDDKFVVRATAAVRYEYVLEGGPGETLRIASACCDVRCPLSPGGTAVADAFLKAFAAYSPDLVRRLEISFPNIAASGIVGNRQTFGSRNLVGEVALVYHQAREAVFATIAFYERGYYQRELQVPAGPVPEEIIPGAAK